MTAVLMPKRLCLAVSSRSVRRQPEKLGRRCWKVWNKVLPGDRCWQSGVLVDQVCQWHEWSQVSRCGIVKNSVAQYCNLILYALRDPQPVKADECICQQCQRWGIIPAFLWCYAERSPPFHSTRLLPNVYSMFGWGVPRFTETVRRVWWPRHIIR